MKKGLRNKGGGKRKKKRDNNKSSANNDGKPKLRFKIGDRVDCLLRGEWETGTVLKLGQKYENGQELIILFDNGEVIKTDHATKVRKSDSPPLQIEYPKGSRIECKLGLEPRRGIWGEEWRRGTIIEADKDWAENERPPYMIKFDDEAEISPFIGPLGMIRRAPLRFDVGDRVEMKMWWEDDTGPSDEPGTIVDLWPKCDLWEEGGTVPYGVRLDNGQLVYSKYDIDTWIISSDLPPIPVTSFVKGDRVECKADEDDMWRQGNVIQSNLDWAERDCPPFFIRFDSGECDFIYGTDIRVCDSDPLIPTSEALEKLGLSDNNPLFETPPPMPDCPICFLPLPIEDAAYKNQSCCGTTICDGCLQAHRNAAGVEKTCPFCRVPEFRSNKETLRLMKNRVELNDAENIFCLGCHYDTGSIGLPKDPKKAAQLYVRAADLGSPRACTNAYAVLFKGKVLERDEAKARYYLEKGAKLGQVKARHMLGNAAANKEEWDLALRHWKIAASAGFQPSLDELKDSYKRGMLSKEELIECLRANQKTLSEAWSVSRAEAAANNNSEFS